MPAAAAEHYHPLGDSQSQSHLRPYLPTAQLSFMTAQEREDAKRVAKDARKAAARSKREAGDGNDALHGYSYEQLEAIKAQNLVDNANRPLVVGTGVSDTDSLSDTDSPLPFTRAYSPPVSFDRLGWNLGPSIRMCTPAAKAAICSLSLVHASPYLKERPRQLKKYVSTR
jgi:hypothetical protein